MATSWEQESGAERLDALGGHNRHSPDVEWADIHAQGTHRDRLVPGSSVGAIGSNVVRIVPSRAIAARRASRRRMRHAHWTLLLLARRRNRRGRREAAG